MATLGEVAALFARLGATAFGGPAAHIAMLHRDVVIRRRWISDTDFAGLLAVTNLLPGPNSTEMAIHVGRHVAGWRGLVAAGVLFILPGATLVALIAAWYVRYGRTRGPCSRASNRWSSPSSRTPSYASAERHSIWQLRSAGNAI